ncbi:MAG: DUF3553 domain-containing protein [Alphaproteobacteria bacterium]|nr:DUF3553 domain-containing protein [Alphaproteobacteria bacterium]
MTLAFAPGDWVKLLDAPDWGAGQVQSVIGERVTVNFEHAGKRLVNAAVAALVNAQAPGASETG